MEARTAMKWNHRASVIEASSLQRERQCNCGACERHIQCGMGFLLKKGMYVHAVYMLMLVAILSKQNAVGPTFT